MWYDLEGFDADQHPAAATPRGVPQCAGRASSTRSHYVSGVYSSAGSGIWMLDQARVTTPTAYHLPDQIWIARWDGEANTSTSYIRDDGWRPGGRMKQYLGGHDER